MKSDAFGRQIYIHELTLLSLAQESRQAAEIVFSTLAKVKINKIVHSYTEDGIRCGILDRSHAKKAMDLFEEESAQALNRCLQEVLIQQKSGDPIPLLDIGERIDNACSEAGYFTFATTPKASERMFAATGSMRRERIAIQQGKGPDDILYIKGRNRLTLQTGQHTLHNDQVEDIQQRVTEKIVLHAKEIVKKKLSDNNPEAHELVSQLLKTLATIAKKTTFHP